MGSIDLTGLKKRHHVTNPHLTLGPWLPGLFILGALGLLAGCASLETREALVTPPVPDNVVFTINGLPVTRDELEAEVQLVKDEAPPWIEEKELRGMLPEIRKEARNRLIYERLINAELEKHGIHPTDEQVEEEYKVMEEYYDAHSIPLDTVIEFQAGNSDGLRQAIHDQLAVDALWDTLLGLEEPTEEQCRKFHERNRKQYVLPEAVRLHEIWVGVPPDEVLEPDEQRRLRANIQSLRERWEAGTPFAELAREASDGPFAAKGGEIGWVPREVDLPPEVIEAAFAQQIDEIGPVVESQFGFHLLWVSEHRSERQVPYEEVAAIVSRDFKRTRRDRDSQKFYQKMRRRAEIIDY